MPNDRIYKFRVWLSKRWPLALFIVVVLLLYLIPTLLNKPPAPITRTYGSSTQHVNVLWFRQDVSTWITANDEGMVYAVPLTWHSLIAMDAQTGYTVWMIPLTFEQSDVRSFLANQNTVYVVTTIEVDSYNAKNGKLQWSTKLGDGHVSIMSQLDSNLLRVYYGDQIYELDSDTGKLLDIFPKGNTVWISGNTVLKGFNAFDRQTDKLLWKEGPPFDIGEREEPKSFGTNILLVAAAPGSNFSRGICALNLQDGTYRWCRPEEFNSMIAIDNYSLLGYAMRNDFVLLTIDLETGNVLGETSFLSSNPNEVPMGSQSSVTSSNGVVIVSFNDSLQTFALQLK